MLSRIRWPHLTAIAGGAGMGVGAMILLLNREREQFANQAQFIQNAVNKLRQQPEAVKLLGDDFEVGKASLQDGWGSMSNTQVRVRVPIKGKSDNASLYVYAKKREKMEKYRLYKLEMTFDKVVGRKLVLMDLGEESEGEPIKEVEVEKKVVKEESPIAKLRRQRVEEAERKLIEQQKDPRKHHPTVRMLKPSEEET